MNRAKMSAHSRAALGAADTVRNVIASFKDAPFMGEHMSDRFEARHRYSDMARELVGDAPMEVLERIGREMELEHGL